MNRDLYQLAETIVEMICKADFVRDCQDMDNDGYYMDIFRSYDNTIEVTYATRHVYFGYDDGDDYFDYGTDEELIAGLKALLMRCKMEA